MIENVIGSRRISVSDKVVFDATRVLEGSDEQMTRWTADCHAVRALKALKGCQPEDVHLDATLNDQPMRISERPDCVGSKGITGDLPTATSMEIVFEEGRGSSASQGTTT